MEAIDLEILIKTKEREIELLKKQRTVLIDKFAAAKGALAHNSEEQERLRREIIDLLRAA